MVIYLTTPQTFYDHLIVVWTSLGIMLVIAGVFMAQATKLLLLWHRSTHNGKKLLTLILVAAWLSLSFFFFWLFIKNLFFCQPDSIVVTEKSLIVQYPHFKYRDKTIEVNSIKKVTYTEIRVGLVQTYRSRRPKIIITTDNDEINLVGDTGGEQRRAIWRRGASQLESLRHGGGF
jgi:hypothetical protein